MIGLIQRGWPYVLKPLLFYSSIYDAHNLHTLAGWLLVLISMSWGTDTIDRAAKKCGPSGELKWKKKRKPFCCTADHSIHSIFKAFEPFMAIFSLSKLLHSTFQYPIMKNSSCVASPFISIGFSSPHMHLWKGMGNYSCNVLKTNLKKEKKRESQNDLKSSGAAFQIKVNLKYSECR